MKLLKFVALALSCVVALSLVAYSIIDGMARMRSAAVMADAANKFLASLSPEQKAKATFNFADENRRDWTFVPRERKGVPLKDLNENQRKLAMEFMKTGLGASGYQKATTIISLEPSWRNWKARTAASRATPSFISSRSLERRRPKLRGAGALKAITSRFISPSSKAR
ncbi:MAG: DUF3500 domain-containing protein [Blastocatellia bacterium]